jgi:hypothetical protein
VIKRLMHAMFTQEHADITVDRYNARLGGRMPQTVPSKDSLLRTPGQLIFEQMSADVPQRTKYPTTCTPLARFENAGARSLADFLRA